MHAKIMEDSRVEAARVAAKAFLDAMTEIMRPVYTSDRPLSEWTPDQLGLMLVQTGIEAIMSSPVPSGCEDLRLRISAMGLAFGGLVFRVNEMEAMEMLVAFERGMDLARGLVMGPETVTQGRP